MSEPLVENSGATIQLPDGTTGYFTAQFVEDNKDIADCVYMDQTGQKKYQIKQLSSNGRILIFHNNETQKDYVVPMSAQVEDYSSFFIAEVLNLKVLQNKGLTVTLNCSTNSEVSLEKYDKTSLVKMNKQNTKNMNGGKDNYATTFILIMKFQKLSIQDKNYVVIPVCFSIKKQSQKKGFFVTDIGGSSSGEDTSVIFKINSGSQSTGYSGDVIYPKNLDVSSDARMFFVDLNFLTGDLSGRYCVGKAIKSEYLDGEIVDNTTGESE